MKILHVTCASSGGAGIAARRLSQALRSQGIDSNMFVQFGPDDLPDTVALSGVAYWIARIRRSIMYRVLFLLGDTLRSIAVLPSGVRKKIIKLNPDIVHLHWINDEMLRPEDLPKLAVPVVWTLHDMWPFCGAEHYTESRRYIDGYSKTDDRSQRTEDSLAKEVSGQGVQETDNKQPITDNRRPKVDIDRWTFRRKQKAWKNWKPHIVTCSNWLARCARKSMLLGDLQVDAIPNCLDQDVFKPMDQVVARKQFNLPVDKKLILFGAFNPSDCRKGGDLLEGALLKLKLANAELVVFGASAGPQFAGLKTHWPGSLSKEADLAQLYNATDLMAVPSRQDNLPNTIVESLSCGTPVVAFDIGGMSDMIIPRQNGYLAKPFDCADFANGIQWILNLDEKEYSELSENGRAKAEAEWAESVVASKYRAVYEKLGRVHGE